MNGSKTRARASVTTTVTIAAASVTTLFLLGCIWSTYKGNKRKQDGSDNDEGNDNKNNNLSRGNKMTKSYSQKNNQIRQRQNSSGGSSIYENMERRVDKFERSKNSSVSASSSPKDRELSTVQPPIPSHLEREDWKERRRVKMLPLLAMKKPMYDNVKMLDPQGEILCTISAKKGRWYVEKSLADWTDPQQQTCIKLRFEPKNRSSRGEKGLYNRSDKINACVVCGEVKYHMRHYVVPYAYRTLLPDKYKAHLSHDIVILCPNCHLHCEKERQMRMNEMEESLRKPGDEPQFRTDRSLYHVRSCALALMRSRDKLPLQKRVEYETLVRKHLNLPSSTQKGEKEEKEELTKEQLQQAIDVEYQIENSNYIPGPNLVVQSLGGDDEKIEKFIKEWRVHFLETAKPCFLPTGWSVDNAVVCGTD